LPSSGRGGARTLPQTTLSSAARRFTPWGVMATLWSSSETQFKGIFSPSCLAPVADCFVHLHAPHELPGRVTDFAAEMFREPKEGFTHALAVGADADD
jgi:hypothetical protein